MTRRTFNGPGGISFCLRLVVRSELLFPRSRAEVPNQDVFE